MAVIQVFGPDPIATRRLGGLSTKTGTIVELVPAGERATAEMGALLEPLEGGSLGGLVGLVFSDEAKQLVSEQG